MNTHSMSLRYLTPINILFSRMLRVRHTKYFTFLDVLTCNYNMDTTVWIVTQK
jgi:hypothetical protein